MRTHDFDKVFGQAFFKKLVGVWGQSPHGFIFSHYNFLHKGVIILQLSRNVLNLKASTTLAIAAKTKQLIASGVDVVDFTVGEPDSDTPGNIKQAAIDAINGNFTRYTDVAGVYDLRSVICDKLRADNGLSYEPGQIIVSNGAKQALSNAFFAILNPGDEVIVPVPYWVSYPQMVYAAGGVPVFVDTLGSDFVGAIKGAITAKTKAIIVNTPSNPSGRVLTESELSQIAELAISNDLIIISDEIYERLVFDQDAPHISIVSLGEEIADRTILVNGLSKSYAMTGWRIGYSASNTDIARVLSYLQGHCQGNTNSITQKAAIEALAGSQDSVRNMVASLRKRRDYVVKRLKNIPGFDFVYPQGGLSVFVGISGLLGGHIKNGNDFAEALLNSQNISLVPGTDFGSDKHIRISFATSMERIVEGFDRIETFLKGC